jgi:hypothetical protein
MATPNFVLVWNSEKTAVPPFGVMEVLVDTVTDSGTDVAGNIVIRKPTRSGATDVLFNGSTPIPPFAQGQGHQTFPTIAAYEEGVPITGEIWGTAPGSWLLSSGIAGSGFTIIGGDSTPPAGLVNVMREDAYPNHSVLKVRAYLSSLPGDYVFDPVNSPNLLYGTNPETLDAYSDSVVLVVGDPFMVNLPGGNAANGPYQLVRDGKDNLYDGAVEAAEEELTGPDILTEDVFSEATDNPYWVAVRTQDADTSVKVKAGMLVQVGPEGANDGSSLWQLITPNLVVLNTTALTWTLLAPYVDWGRITSQAKSSGRYPGTVYDRDLNSLVPIWVNEASGLLPGLGVFYEMIRATDANGRRVYNLRAPEKVKGVLSGTLNKGSSAPMRIWDWNGTAEADSGFDVTVWDWLLTTGDTIASGTNVTAFFRSGRWYIDEASCNAGAGGAGGGLTGTYP